MKDNKQARWWDESLNVSRGCTKASPGCQHCYAETIDRRFNKAHRPWVEHADPIITLYPDRLSQPAKWRKPRRVFINSMSDLFHDRIPDSYRDKVFCMARDNPKHIFMLLTKRAGTMRDTAERYLLGSNKPPRNLWLGISAEYQNLYERRTRALMESPAALHFVSLEPLLGPIDMGWPDRALPDWVIVGAETGPGARPMNPHWVRDIREQCQEAGVPLFVKQMSKGETVPKDLLIRDYPE